MPMSIIDFADRQAAALRRHCGDAAQQWQDGSPACRSATHEHGNERSRPHLPRIFLVVVDDSEELRVALRYAALRARRTGGKVALLYVIEPSDLQQWLAVESLMREEERREESRDAAAEARGRDGPISAAACRSSISARKAGRRVVGAARRGARHRSWCSPAPAGRPGPLVTHLVGRCPGKMRMPITVVPGSLSDEQIMALT